MINESLRVRYLEQESNFHSKLDGACYSGYLGKSWGRGKRLLFIRKIEIDSWIDLVPQTDILKYLHLLMEQNLESDWFFAGKEALSDGLNPIL